MKLIQLTPIRDFNKQCNCSTCEHQEVRECVEAKCNCCKCYETSGNLAIKPDNCHCCTDSHDDCCHDEENDSHCDDDCCKNENYKDCCDGKDEPILKEAPPLDRNLSSAVYQISGMDCPACARTIEKSVSQIPGITGVQVHYSTGKMRVAYSDASRLSPIPKQLSRLGYRVKPEDSLNSQTKTNVRDIYRIEGMDCGTCAKSIEKHLNRFPEVQSLEVNFSSGKMSISHTLSAERIQQEVKKMGYQALPDIHDEQENDQHVHSHKSRLEILISGLCIAAGFVLSFTQITFVLPTALYGIALIISGRQPLRNAYYALRSRSLDMNVLMSAAAIGAVFINQWLESATVVWLFALGAVLENRSIEKTRRSIGDLMKVAPTEAWIKSGDSLIKKLVSAVTVGETMVVKPGECIPLDGEVIKGESSVNQAPITGEAIPVDKSQGDAVFAGTMNENGTLECQITKLSTNTAIARIIQMVEEAQEKQAPTQTFVDRFARIYTPIVFILAVAVMLIPPMIGIGTWGSWFYKGLELLVVACPCALVISTPVAIVSAIGNAAKQGVLIKGGAFLEKAGQIQAIAFDKTGTITEGKPKVASIIAFTSDQNHLMSLIKTLEDYSTHPIARCLSAYANEKNSLALAGENYQNIPGKGVQADISGTIYYAGSLKLFREKGVGTIEEYAQAHKLLESGQTLVMIGTDEKLIGVIGVSDTIRKTTRSALNKLQKIGIHDLVMLTGDNQKTAEQVAKEAAITRYLSDLLPEDKVTSIKKLQASGLKTAMVGDGINDAPALASADLGIAMGGAGTDTAMETADLVLMADNLEKLPFAISLSQKSLKIIKQNISFALIVKAAALFLIFPGWLTLWLAVFSDTGAALLVILNSLRLFHQRN
ncbi:heavy metal translocating P-type ATPase [Sporolactobacillus nakayamae]|uniref:Cd(2+)-exporting ATPase n=1 Tax=Sporolactobacillus nakayamae TaxID=269670 RepID=A0A1I2N0K3_9BACL|nr:heavy metal translocating P-type ATPase [Sporolactobacillus nakayamae]SFF97405.1 Cd2+/Zn2+-exporting ATPase [Sporolactobacillus nakayamae]